MTYFIINYFKFFIKINYLLKLFSLTFNFIKLFTRDTLTTSFLQVTIVIFNFLFNHSKFQLFSFFLEPLVHQLLCGLPHYLFLSLHNLAQYFTSHFNNIKESSPSLVHRWTMHNVVSPGSSKLITAQPTIGYPCNASFLVKLSMMVIRNI